MKRVLLTGGAGFIGHHVAEHLLKTTDWDIVFLDRLDCSGNANRITEIQDWKRHQTRCRWQFHDLRAPLNNQLIAQIGRIDYVLHLAALTHVDRSIDDPLAAVYDNVVGSAHVLEYCRAVRPERVVYFSTDEVFGPAPPGTAYKEWDRYRSTNPYSATKAGGEELALAYHNTYGVPVMITHCHDAATRAMTPTGPKDVSALAVGDLVYALRGEDIVETPIREIVRNRYKGEMVRIKSRKVNQLVTPNHRVMLKWRNASAFEYVEAADMLGMGGKRARIPKSGKWHCEPAIDIDVCEGKTLHRNVRRPMIIGPKVMMELLGWFASEGCTSGGSVHFGCADPARQQSLCETLRKIGLAPAIHGRSVEASSLPLAQFFIEHCGELARNKKLPLWALQWRPEYLRILLDALIDGDGTRYGKAAYYYTTSHTLAWQVVDLCMKLGYSARVMTRETWNPRKTVKSKSLVVSIADAMADIEKNNVSSEQYDGEIWCVRTDESNFFIEREGVTCCSGNTMNVFGERQHPEKFIPGTIAKVRDGKTVTVHADKTRTKAGSRFYIHARNVASAVQFVLQHGEIGEKYNVVGEREIDNLTLAQMIAGFVGQPLRHEMVDFHSSRPGHDLRYALDGSKLAQMGWQAPVSFEKSMERMVRWTLKHEKWLLEKLEAAA